MKGLLIAGLGLTGFAAEAGAQDRPGASYPVPGRTMTRTAPPPAPAMTRIDPNMVATTPRRPGTDAPGGYAAYRRPVRGQALPAYWTDPRFAVSDWQSYGLPQPPQGYRWTRYYDDAVLVDDRGAVYDTEQGVDWERRGYATQDVAGASGAYDRRPPAPPPPRVGADYSAPGHASPGYTSPAHGGPGTYTTTVPAGGTHVVHVGPGITTITVRTEPAVTTTTTTEYHDETVTYRRAPRAPARRAFRSKTKLR